MTFAPTSVEPGVRPDAAAGVEPGAAAGFALGVFRRRTAGTAAGVGPDFTGLVRGGRVRDVSALGTVNDLLADWDSALATLAELAEDDTQTTQPTGPTSPTWTSAARSLPGRSCSAAPTTGRTWSTS